MSRYRTSATLDAGTRLTLSGIPLAPMTGLEITWRISKLVVTASMRLGENEGEIRLRYDGQEQKIALSPALRHFGGMQ